MGTMRPDIFCAIAFLLLGACTQQEIGDAQYAASQCRRIALIDAKTGLSIRGAEDFAYDDRSKRLFFSAYDRRAVEKAAKSRKMKIPDGGVYSAALSEIFDPEVSAVTVTPLAAPDDVAGGLRPHGIAFDAYNNELVFINRTYQRMNNKWRMTPRLQRVGADGEMFVGEYVEAVCAANDVVVTAQHTFTSYDHGICDWRAGFEDIFNLKRSGVALDHESRIYKGAAFANGLVQAPNGMIVLAATREKSLIMMHERAGAVEEASRVIVPGGPDNLSISADGLIVAAVHPSLWRLGLNRKMSFGKSPSRIVKVDPKTGAVDILFDDRSGKLFSAATIAVETSDGLVAGSVTDEGVLVCREAL